MRTTRYQTLVVAVLATLVILAGCQAVGSGSTTSEAPRTPVVLFPAFHLTKLQVTVHDQVVAPECPRSGSFEDWFRNDHPSATFNQVCQDKLLTLRYSANPATPMPGRFSNQQGVTVEIKNYGTTDSAPFYEPLYKTLESTGYRRNRDIRVAGYDARLTPDIGEFLQRTQKLIEDTYRDNGNRPVHLIGHSNGPLYAHYLLTHITRAWRAKYIHGLTALAGNFPGQGLLYPSPIHRAEHRGLRLSGDEGQRCEQCPALPDCTVDLSECLRSNNLRRSRDRHRRHVHRPHLHTARLPTTDHGREPELGQRHRRLLRRLRQDR